MKRCIITILFVLVFALQCFAACTSRKNNSPSDSIGPTDSVSDEENTFEPSEKQDGDNDVIWEN